MNKVIQNFGVIFSLLLLTSVSMTAQVKKKTTTVKRTVVAQTKPVLDLTCFDLKGKVHTCIEWSNAGGPRNKRIFDRNGKWIGYRDDGGFNIWNNISGLKRDAKGRITFYREKDDDYTVPKAISYDSAGRVSKITSVFDEETDETVYSYDSKGRLIKEVFTATDMSEENVSVYKYSNYEFDSHGNWTSRICEFEVDGNPVRECISRVITYYK